MTAKKHFRLNPAVLDIGTFIQGDVTVRSVQITGDDSFTNHQPMAFWDHRHPWGQLRLQAQSATSYQVGISIDSGVLSPRVYQDHLIITWGRAREEVQTNFEVRVEEPALAPAHPNLIDILITIIMGLVILGLCAVLMSLQAQSGRSLAPTQTQIAAILASPTAILLIIITPPTQPPLIITATDQPSATPIEVYYPSPTNTPYGVGVIQCNADVVTRIYQGSHGRVAGIGMTVNLRLYPGIGSTVVRGIAPGTSFTVVGDLQCADGLVWWPIHTDNNQTVSLDSNLDGWVAESFGYEYLIEPIP